MFKLSGSGYWNCPDVAGDSADSLVTYPRSLILHRLNHNPSLPALHRRVRNQIAIVHRNAERANIVGRLTAGMNFPVTGIGIIPQSVHIAGKRWP